MAYDLKLHVFTLTLRERYKVANSFNWKEFVELFKGKDYEKKFSNLFIEYVKHFDGKFIVYKNWSKGISLSKSGVTYGSKNNYIIGKVEGGYTDIASVIKDKDNVEDEGYAVTRNHVNAIPFHFLLWLPPNSNKGLLIVQSIGDKSIHEPLKLNLKRFVESINEKLVIDFNEHITKTAIDRMKNGTISQLVIKRSALPTDQVERVFNKKYNIVDNINIEIKISGFGNSTISAIKDYMTGKNPDLLEIDNLKEIGVDDDYDVLATFKHNGRTATAKMDKDFSIKPVYYIDGTDVPLDINNHPDEVKLKIYMLSFFAEMKKEMGFSK
jgi:hypothetical protein